MSVQVCTFFPDFPDEDHQPPLTLRFATDTKEPQTLVPVLLIHSLENPFCHNPHCACQQNRAQKTALFARITQSEMLLRLFSDALEGGN